LSLRFDPYSLRFKLMLASTLVEAVMLSFLLFNTTRLIDNAMLASADAALGQTVTMLNGLTAPYLVQGDYATLQDNLNEIVVKTDQGVVYVVVQNTAAQVVAKAGIANLKSLPPPDKTLVRALDGAVLHIERPLTLAGQPVGTLRFGLSTQIIAQAKTALLRQSGLIALAEIVVTFVFLSLLGYWLTRNLGKFVKSSQAIADGHYDLRLPEKGRDEVANLARNFNRMSHAVELKIAELKTREQELRELNEQLESRVEARSHELRLAMDQIVESEKLASLGKIVAGVAHELNTPIGNVMLMTSTMKAKISEFSRAFAAERVSRSMIQKAIAELENGNNIVERSAHRAGELVESFKRVAVDQTSQRRRGFDLRIMLEDILNTLGTITRHANVKIALFIPPGIEMDSFPGHFEQIFNNLILNSIKHAFPGRDNALITITAQQIDDCVEIVYQDNGHGIAKHLHRKVFEPFYTSQMATGGSGLGMFIVHNLIHGVLMGNLRIESEVDQGLRLIFLVPAVTPHTTAHTTAHDAPPNLPPDAAS
jgi:signal transduction histidine kinase